MISGCSMLPYDDNFTCNMAVEAGSCMSVSNNYKYLQRQQSNYGGVYSNALHDDGEIPRVIVIEGQELERKD
jgi:hypothetical protein